MNKCKSFLLLLATVAVCYARYSASNPKIAWQTIRPSVQTESVMFLTRCRKLDEQDILHTMQKILKKSEKEVNNRPLIGVLSQVSLLYHWYWRTEDLLLSTCNLCSTQPGEPAPEGMSYIAASYVKFVEVHFVHSHL